MKSLFLTAVLALLLLSAPTIYACSCVVLQFSDGKPVGDEFRSSREEGTAEVNAVIERGNDGINFERE
jgi:hypothetical protein